MEEESYDEDQTWLQYVFFQSQNDQVTEKLTQIKSAAELAMHQLASNYTNHLILVTGKNFTKLPHTFFPLLLFIKKCVYEAIIDRVEIFVL